MFEDLSFDRGFLLGYPHASKGRAVEATLDLGDPEGKPAWRLCQWATKYSLADTPCVQGQHGDVSYENPGKRVVVGGPDSPNRDLILDIRGGTEYGDAPRKAGQGWPHLLVEQDAPKPFRLDSLERIDLNVSVKLLHCTSHMTETDYNPGLHAAQFQLFFIVKNVNPEAKDYRDFFWFGVPFFDNRRKSPQAYMAKDGGKADATGKFIYTVAAADLGIASLHDRQWVSVDTNLLPHIKHGLAEAVKRGYLNSGDLRDYAVVNMNMGWEIPGTFDAAVQVKDLKISAVPSDKPQQMKLWRQIDLGEHKGSFVCVGDLNNDTRADFLLYREGPMTTPGYLVAIDHQGERLWERGDPTVTSHQGDGQWNEPALRGIAFIYDINRDGKSEVVTELWKEGTPWLCVLAGDTGQVLHERVSPLDLDVRGGRRSRCHPVGRVAYLQGKDHTPAIVLKYGASNFVPCLGVALDAELNERWQLHTSRYGMGHVPSVGDVDGDGRDEIIFGTVLADEVGRALWEQPTGRHADCTAIADVHPAPGHEVLISICSAGPAYCLSASGEVLWQKTKKEVPHGQGIWAGNFIDDEPGREVIILRSGHVGDFITVRGTDGTELAAFRHKRTFKGYPDFPCVVNWTSGAEQSLWVPIDRTLVDGRGRVVAELGDAEPLVAEKLKWGETKSNLAVQAFTLDLCGDAREELVLYQPYNGRAILIFTQPDSDGRDKPYVHDEDVYNIRSYF